MNVHRTAIISAVLVLIYFLASCAGFTQSSLVKHEKEKNPEHVILKSDVMIEKFIDEDPETGSVLIMLSYREFPNMPDTWPNPVLGSHFYNIFVNIHYPLSEDVQNIEETTPVALSVIIDRWIYDFDEMVKTCWQWVMIDRDVDGVPDSAVRDIIGENRKNSILSHDSDHLIINEYIKSYFKKYFTAVYMRYLSDSQKTANHSRTFPAWFRYILGKDEQ